MTGVVILQHDLVVVIADATDEFGKIEVASRQRVLASEDLQKIWPVARLADRSASHLMKAPTGEGGDDAICAHIQDAWEIELAR